MTVGEEEAVAAALGRAAAVTGAVCVAVHLAGATAGGHGSVERLLLAGMAAACLPCVRALWRRPEAGVWRSTAVMYGAMAFVHVLLITAAGGAGHAGHAGAGPPVAGWTVAGMWAGLALAGVQVVLAGTVLAAGRVQLPPGEVTVARPG